MPSNNTENDVPSYTAATCTQSPSASSCADTERATPRPTYTLAVSVLPVTESS